MSTVNTQPSVAQRFVQHEVERIASRVSEDFTKVVNAEAVEKAVKPAIRRYSGREIFHHELP